MPDALAAMRYPDFVRYVSASFFLTFGILAQEVVVGYELYRLTHDPLVLGLVGLAEAIPFIAVALFAGHFADRMPKKRILYTAMAIIMAGSAYLAWAFSVSGHTVLGERGLVLSTYGVVALVGLARAFYSPTAFALKGFLTPREVYPNASAWSSSAWQMGAVLGPASGGVLFALLGGPETLWGIVGITALVVVIQSGITEPPLPEQVDMNDDIFASLKEGISFVWNTRPVLYSISLDLFSVLFGGVVAILPVFAEDILKVGPQGLGALRAAPAIGAVITLLMLTRHQPTRNSWRKLLAAVAGFGLCTIVFGLSTWFYLSIFMLFLTGAFDAVSVVVRGTYLQQLTPDHMRGRVGAVNSVFISTSNELGAFESGVAARLLGTVTSVVAGGLVTIGVVGYMATKKMPDLDADLVKEAE